MLAPAYHRTLLSPGQQAAYRTVVMALLRRQTEIPIEPPLSDEALRQVVRAVHLDHPELFYVNFWQFSISHPGLSRSILHFSLMLEERPAAAVGKTLYQRAEDLREPVRQAPNPAQAYFLLAREIGTNTRYVNTGSTFWEHTAAGPVLCHRSVCEGIAKLFLFYCQRLELPCALVTGELQGVPHAWNVVEPEGEGKYIDVTALLQTIRLLPPISGVAFQREETLRRLGYSWDSRIFR